MIQSLSVAIKQRSHYFYLRYIVVKTGAFIIIYNL